MGIEEALALAARIGSGNYGQNELEPLLRFIENADPGQVRQILDHYQKSFEERQGYHLLVDPDFMDSLRALRPSTREEPVQEIPVITKNVRIHWIRRMAAAAAVIFIASGSYFYLHGKQDKSGLPVQHQVTTDVQAPKTNRATIALAGGRKLYLDSTANGTLASLGNIKVRKLADGQIAYDGSATEVSYNTLTNPRGSKVISIRLADGTVVWLNSGSSLTYPVAFSGKERKVEVAGEAYFEVTHNPAMPFIVQKGSAAVTVLGTHFNVNAYDDETALKVTLLEGAVRISKDANKSLLKPGEQAQVKDENIKLVKDINTEEVMAWKNGKFQFGEAADIGTIMRQISRWYDMDVEYQGNLTGHIGGSISRDVNVSQVLKMLEITGALKFKVEGKKVTVMPAAT